MKTLVTPFLIAIVLFSSQANASCSQGGRTYTDGERVGPFVCDSGKWVRR